MIDIKDQIYTILRATGRPGIETVIDYLENSSYFVRGCYGHHKEEGGLARHSLEVYEHMLAHAGDIPTDTIAIVGLFHDLGKTVPRDRHGHSHGPRGAILLEKLGFHLTRDERTAIWQHHNHFFDFRSHPLTHKLKTADCTSTKAWQHSCIT